MGEEAAQQCAAAGETHIVRVTANSRGFSLDRQNLSSERHIWESKLEMFPASRNKKETFGFSHISYLLSLPDTHSLCCVTLSSVCVMGTSCPLQLEPLWVIPLPLRDHLFCSSCARKWLYPEVELYSTPDLDISIKTICVVMVSHRGIRTVEAFT